MNFDTFKESCLAISSTDWTWSDSDEMLVFIKRLQVHDPSTDDLAEDLNQVDDVAFLVPSHQNRNIKFEINIMYSVVWDAPECYLNAYWEDTGEILEMDRFCSLIKKPIPKLLSKRIHPISRIPFYNLHSCHSQEWMMKGESQNIFMTWLTTVNQMLDLVPLIDLEMLLKAYPK